MRVELHTVSVQSQMLSHADREPDKHPGTVSASSSHLLVGEQDQRSHAIHIWRIVNCIQNLLGLLHKSNTDGFRLGGICPEREVVRKASCQGKDTVQQKQERGAVLLRLKTLKELRPDKHRRERVNVGKVEVEQFGHKLWRG